VSSRALPVRGLGVRVRRFKGQTLLSNDRQVFELSEVAELIWRSIDGIKDESALAGKVALEFNVAPEVAQEDVSRFLGELATDGLIEWR
jgi:hypothetical protein